MSTNPAKANQLKVEGNALFSAQEFKAAGEKYTQAIALDRQNAVLYSNRAACNLALKAYLEAIEDSEKATELDPSYSKAWARLASAQDALEVLGPAIKSWHRAIDTLPKEGLKPSEVKQREQYESSLEATERKRRELKNEQRPADRAKEMLPELLITGNSRSSSAWVILSASQQFEDGVKIMKLIRRTHIPMGMRLTGMTGALTEMSNGILQDKRCFRIDSSDWVQKYNDQGMYISASIRHITPS
ncbi:hypothetical protein EW146_g4600 [Bondarzewia mesenterica]|uniref:Uncharacterized protein n=1 Tax=Bondarzewia mesenterica TaxID=1095465 RepID=A0A4S4LU84_9AGAM|nr:hypothetical protein EW146_g4600 [Bondarzewia mesenterica]